MSEITVTDRAVYELVERGAIDAAHAGLYRRSLLRLANRGLVRRLETGAYQAIRAATDTRPPLANAHVPTIPAPPPPSAPAPESEAMVTLVCRVPQHILDTLDSIGPSRSKAARAVLDRALGSGMRKAVGGVRS